MKKWAAQVALDDAQLAVHLRLMDGVEVCTTEDSIWLRGPSRDGSAAIELSAIAGEKRFAVWEDNQLLPLGKLVPHGYLPNGPWMPIREWLELELPTLAPPAAPQRPSPIRLRLVQDRTPRPSNILCTRLGIWTAYVETAPRIRLDQWSFAINDGDRCVIRGIPLPPLAGTQFVERDGIAVPAGWTWWPSVEPAIVRGLFGLDNGDLGLWEYDSGWQVIPQQNWVRTTRSAVRISARKLDDGSVRS